jgi:hypothetical protein
MLASMRSQKDAPGLAAQKITSCASTTGGGMIEV